MLPQQLGHSRWCATGEVVINTAVNSINLSLNPENIGAQMQITAGASGLVIRAFAPTAVNPANAGTVTSVIGNAGVVTPGGGTPSAVEITLTAYETVVLQVAGDLSAGGAFGGGALGTGVLVVLGKCTLTAI